MYMSAVQHSCTFGGGWFLSIKCICQQYSIVVLSVVAGIAFKGGYTLVTLPRIVTPYRDSVDGTRDRVTYQKLVTW